MTQYKVYYPYAKAYDHRIFYTERDARQHAERELEIMQANPLDFPPQDVHVVKCTQETVGVYS